MMFWDLNCILLCTFISSWNVKAFTSLRIFQGTGETLARVALCRMDLALNRALGFRAYFRMGAVFES